MREEREYGIDALRIVSMLLIATLHVLNEGGVLYLLNELSFRHAVAWFLWTASLTCVNCYALISGYVGVKSRRKASSILELWLQVVFYSVLLSVVVHVLKPGKVPANEWIKGLFPLSHNYYWYYTAYFFISLMMPLMNRMLLAVSKEELFCVLASSLTAVTLISVIGTQGRFLMNEGYSALWLLMLYLAGGCIRLYGDEYRSYRFIKKHAVWLFLLGITAAWAVRVFVGDAKVPVVLGWELPSNVLMNYVSPAILLSSVSLFALFAGWKPGVQMCKWIARISPATFGVYLIHVHPLVWRHYFINGFVTLVYLEAYVLPFGVFGAAAGVFAVCAAIDLIRAKLFRMLRIREGCRRLFAKFGLS